MLPHRAPLRPSGLRGGAATAARRARGGEGMDAWIDTYHAVRRLTREGTYRVPHRQRRRRGRGRQSSAPRHQSRADVPRERIVPFLTSKHTLEYCLSYAERAHQNGFPALVVLGGDKTRRHAAVGRARLAAARSCCERTIRRWRSEGGPIRTRMPNGRSTFCLQRTSRRVLPHADRQPPRCREREPVHRDGGKARG